MADEIELKAYAKEKEEEANFFVELAMSELEFADTIPNEDKEDKELKETLTLAAEAVIERAAKAVAEAEEARILVLKEEIDVHRARNNKWGKNTYRRCTYPQGTKMCEHCGKEVSATYYALHKRFYCTVVKRDMFKLKII